MAPVLNNRQQIVCFFKQHYDLYVKKNHHHKIIEMLLVQDKAVAWLISVNNRSKHYFFVHDIYIWHFLLFSLLDVVSQVYASLV